MFYTFRFGTLPQYWVHSLSVQFSHFNVSFDTSQNLAGWISTVSSHITITSIARPSSVQVKNPGMNRNGVNIIYKPYNPKHMKKCQLPGALCMLCALCHAECRPVCKQQIRRYSHGYDNEDSHLPAFLKHVLRRQAISYRYSSDRCRQHV